MSKFVLNASVIFYFFLFALCSSKSIQSQKNITAINKTNSTYSKGIKQALKLENSADALLNATAKYDKILEKPVDVDSDPRYANLTDEQKEIVARVHRKARENLENQVEKIFNKSEAVRAKAAKIEKQLKKGAKIAEKAKSIQISVNNTLVSNSNHTRNNNTSSRLRKRTSVYDS
jgi:hypothetical protein